MRGLLRIDVAAEEREFKFVTIVFCDVVGSTGLSERLRLEAVQQTMDRFAETARRVLERHGGQTGKRHGDSVMAVFGIPVAYEDDALRAVRAALELRAALEPLGREVKAASGVSLEFRIGVNTGRVLVYDADTLEERVTGPAVNVARRLEEVAEPGGVLISEESYQLVRDAVRAEPIDSRPLDLPGVADPVSAFRLLEVLPDRPGRISRLRAPMLGRDLEQELLHSLFKRTVATRSCHLVTILGAAGVGKTRLADEFSRDLEEQATVLRGHCLAYGDAVTFWPLMQVVYQAAGIGPTDEPAVARERLAALLGTDKPDRQAQSQIQQLLAIDEPSGELPGDTAWALRRLLERLARRQPLVVLVDDLQWAEQSLLDILEYIADNSMNAAIMLLCMARSEQLFERRRQWPGGRRNATSMLLFPLSDPESEQLVSLLLGSRELDPNALAHITHLAQGSPLIVQELVAALIDRGALRELEGRWIATADLPEQSVPSSIQALLSARLDRLYEGDRRIIERAAVVGERFHTADIEALSPATALAQVAGRLDALVRQELIEPALAAASPLPSESGESYRFRHTLIRGAVYERMTESLRAELHERYADHLERMAGDRINQVEELIGYHLDEAYKYRRTLAAPDEHTRQLARRAGERYAAAGRRALLRGNIPLTSSWLGHASRLLPADHPTRLEVLLDLAEALQAAGELRRALRVYDDILETAEAGGDEGSVVHAELGRLYVTSFLDPPSFLAAGRERIERSLPLLQRLDDHLGQAKVWYLLSYLSWAHGHIEKAKEEVERAVALVRVAGNERWEANAVRLRCLVLYWGPAPLKEVERYSLEALELARRSNLRSLEAAALTILARTAAMRGDFEVARRFTKEAADINSHLGELLTQASDSISEGLVELLAGDFAAAERALRGGYAALERMGGSGLLVNVATMLARVLLLEDRYEEAEEFTRVCERLSLDYQLDPQIKWRSIRAVLHARRGDLEAAERLARDAVSRADETDQIESQAEARTDLGEVLRMAGRIEEAAIEFDRALRLHQRKGNEVAARRVRSLLVELRR